MNEEKMNEMTFEVAIARLEEIVRLLESGNAPLDQSLSLFERIDQAESALKEIRKVQASASAPVCGGAEDR